MLPTDLTYFSEGDKAEREDRTGEMTRTEGRKG